MLLDRIERATGRPVAGRDSAEVIKLFGDTLIARVETPAPGNSVERLFAMYEVLERLSSGGMSEGFKVRAPDGAVCFLKKVPVTGIPADALRRELDVYTKLQRAAAVNVLQIHAFERSDDF